MGQLLRIAIILIGIWLVIRIIKRALARPSRGRTPGASAQKMLACEHCGVFVPQSEAVYDGDKAYCCKDHLLTGRGPGA